MLLPKLCFLPVLESIESLKKKCKLMNVEINLYENRSFKNGNTQNEFSNSRNFNVNKIKDFQCILNSKKYINRNNYLKSNFENEKFQCFEILNKNSDKRINKTNKLIIHKDFQFIDKKDEFVVEEIVNHNLTSCNLYFEVKWLNWTEEYNTWEKIQNLQNSFNLVNRYIIKNNIKYTLFLKFFKVSNCIMFQLLHHFINLVINFSLKDPFILNKLISFETKNKNEIKKYLNMLREIKYLYSHKSIYCNQDNLEKKIYLEFLEKLHIFEIFKNEHEFFKFIEKRIEFQNNSRKWLENVNKIICSGNNLPIKIENLVDFEIPPQDFKFLNYNNFSSLSNEIILQINHSKNLLKCNCSNCSVSSECCPKNIREEFYYNNKGLIKNSIITKGPIFECNSNCLCSKTCNNRIIQRGTQIKLAIFKTKNGRGWGLKTLERIPKNKFVTQFLGEIITSKEAKKREILYSRKEKYLFNLDFNIDLSYEYVIDSTYSGNISHFINHSCNPNLEVYIAYIDHIYESIPNIVFFSKRVINVGEELTFDYFPSIINSNSVNFLNTHKNSCKCKEANCKNVIF